MYIVYITVFAKIRCVIRETEIGSIKHLIEHCVAMERINLDVEEILQNGR